MEAMFQTNMEEDLYESYMIGFTSCQVKGTDIPTSTSDMLSLSFNNSSSAAMDYAERWNKGTEKELECQNGILEKRGFQTLKRIQNGITDVVFELSQRRKAPTPLSRFRFDMPTMDAGGPPSPASADSRPSSSQSLPLVQVQQLPPLKKLGGSYPNILRCAADSNRKKSKRKTQRRSRMKENAMTQGNANVAANVSNSFRNLLPRIDSIPLTVIDRNEDTGNEINAPTDNGDNTTQVESNDIVTVPVIGQHLVKVKSKKKSIMYARQSSKVDCVKYNSGIPTSELTFCQSSYTERTEKARLTNVMRRYASQTKSGPMDFNKLRRQISLTSSK